MFDIFFSADEFQLVALLPFALALQTVFLLLQGDRTGCRTGNGEKLSSSQAETGQAIKSAAA